MPSLIIVLNDAGGHVTPVWRLGYDAATIDAGGIMKKGYEVALLLAFGALFAAFAFNLPKTSGEWASWVQAVGAIGAIIAAFIVLSEQRREERRRRLRDREDQVAALAEIIRACELRLTQIYSRLASSNDTLEDKLAFCLRWESMLRTPVNALSAVPFHQVPFAFASIHAMPAIYHLERCLGILNQLNNLNPDDEDADVEAEDLINDFRRKRYEVHVECRLIRSTMRQYNAEEAAHHTKS